MKLKYFTCYCFSKVVHSLEGKGLCRVVLKSVRPSVLNVHPNYSRRVSFFILLFLEQRNIFNKTASISKHHCFLIGEFFLFLLSDVPFFKLISLYPKKVQIQNLIFLRANMNEKYFWQFLMKIFILACRHIF